MTKTVTAKNAMTMRHSEKVAGGEKDERMEWTSAGSGVPAGRDHHWAETTLHILKQ